MTTYSNRSNATRAAKKAGLEKFSIIEVDGKFSIEESKPLPAAEPTKADKRSAAMADRADFSAKQKAPKAAKAPKANGISMGERARITKQQAKAPAPKKAPARSKAPAPGAKGAKLIEMITRGATISELMKALG
jgi:hypothetical protein